MNAVIILLILVYRGGRRFVIEENVRPALGTAFVVAAAIAGPQPQREANRWTPVSCRPHVAQHQPVCELSRSKAARVHDTDVDKWLQTFTNKHGVAEVLPTPQAQSHLRRVLGYGGTAVYSFWRKLRAVIAVRPPPKASGKETLPSVCSGVP
jgi:hypothetical protein